MFVLGFIVGAVALAIVFNIIHTKTLTAFYDAVDNFVDKVKETLSKL